MEPQTLDVAMVGDPLCFVECRNVFDLQLGLHISVGCGNRQSRSSNGEEVAKIWKMVFIPSGNVFNFLKIGNKTMVIDPCFLWGTSDWKSLGNHYSDWVTCWLKFQMFHKSLTENTPNWKILIFIKDSQKSSVFFCRSLLVSGCTYMKCLKKGLRKCLKKCNPSLLTNK